MCACIMHVCAMACVLRNQKTTLGVRPHFPLYLRQKLLFIAVCQAGRLQLPELLLSLPLILP